MSKVRINVGGVQYKCYATTLERFEDSLLSNLNQSLDSYDPIDDEYFFDRNPLIFNFILDGYRTGVIHLPKDVCGSKIRQELEFWGLSVNDVSKCCWETLYTSDDDIETIETLKKFHTVHSPGDMSQHGSRFQQKIWLFLHEPKSSSFAKAWSVFISLVIMVSVIVSAVESMSGARTGSYSEAEIATIQQAVQLIRGNKTYTLFFQNLLKKPHMLVTIIDTGCFVFITMELILVFLSCPKRSEFLKSWLHMSEVVCSIAFWFYFICERKLEHINSVHLIRAFIVCKYLTILKLVRLFRIAKHIPALQIMGLTLRVSKYELNVLTLLLFMMTSLFGVAAYISECIDNNNFDNIFTAMYWALITMTTVGYGNYTPSTPLGHVIACVCSICGVLTLALPIGIIASTFNNLYYHHQYVCKHIKSSHLGQHVDTSPAAGIATIEKRFLGQHATDNTISEGQPKDKNNVLLTRVDI